MRRKANTSVCEQCCISSLLDQITSAVFVSYFFLLVEDESLFRIYVQSTRDILKSKFIPNY